MPEIEAQAEPTADGWRVSVRILEDDDVSEYEVAVRKKDLPAAAKGRSVEEVVAASFRFLLDREPKEAIMRRFDLPTISRYFPEYEKQIGSYL